MADHEAAMCAYVQLAVISDQKQQALHRDRFYLLAGVAACRAGWLEVAEVCRVKLLATSPAHQLKKFASLPDALRDPDFQLLVSKWERHCPFEQAEHLLMQLGLTPFADQPELSRGERMLQLLDLTSH